MTRFLRTDVELDAVDPCLPQRMIGMDESVVGDSSLERADSLRIRKCLMPVDVSIFEVCRDARRAFHHSKKMSVNL